ncbi:MAG: hypothetical protein ACHQUA_00610 [Microgenomates group bacterium]
MGREISRMGEALSNEEISSRARGNARAGLSEFLGIKKSAIKFKGDGENGPWDVRIKGSAKLGIRMHQNGALEALSPDGESWKRIQSADELEEIYIDKNSGRSSLKKKINRDKFDPNKVVLDQIEFIGTEKAEDKPFEEKLKRYGKKFVSEITQSENTIGFLAGGAGVILVHALAAGDVGAAAVLRDLLVNSNKCAAIASALLTSAHPLLYWIETRFGKDTANRKLIKNIRRATNLLAMAGWGATITEGTIGVFNHLTTDEDSKGVQGHAEFGQKEETPIVETPPEIQQNPTDVEQPPVEVETQPLYPKTDVEAAKVLDEFYHEMLGDGDWINDIDNNGQDLSNVLHDKTFEYLADNKINIRALDFNAFKENPEYYLTGSQLENLNNIANTADYSEYLQYLNNN